MPDREKVVKAMKKLREYADSKVHPIVSPDNWEIYCELRDLIDEAEEDVLTLLKAQEPMKPNEIRHGNMFMYYQCPSCTPTLRAVDKYCSQCGKAVKWE